MAIFIRKAWPVIVAMTMAVAAVFGLGWDASARVNRKADKSEVQAVAEDTAKLRFEFAVHEATHSAQLKAVNEEVHGVREQVDKVYDLLIHNPRERNRKE